MENLILIVHVLAALAIIGLILLQQGKGAVAGASFGGGASQTVFGSQGGGSFFTRATAIFAVIFFATSFGLAIIAKQDANIGSSDIPAVIESEQEVPAQDSEVPQAEDEGAASDVPAVEGESTPEEEVPAVPETPAEEE